MNMTPSRMGGQGSDVHASERRDPNKIRTESQPALDPINALRPWGTPEEKALRRRLHKAWSIGAARATSAQSGSARSIFWLAAQTASDWTFAPRSEADLKEMADCLVRLFLCAGAFERLEGAS